ncbi:YHYH protein [Leeia aquatica]|uniref:YHYH protein n=1 Tax=Leeia aquatica TaxID=2725557 RepID=A0A847SFU6_9NEIS|nr:YHYH protein [Leeia aquatica]NLR76296.1 YHYH protein [Leeia aquatica]
MRSMLIVLTLGLTAVHAAPDPHHLPLGDGKISSQPQRGYVYVCNSRFDGGGAQVKGDWIQGAFWDETRKLSVQGQVSWPDARFSISLSADSRLLQGNGLPLGHVTGVFPVARSDPAYAVDRNPNRISSHTVQIRLPRQPLRAAQPSCVPMGMIGVALSGVPIYNALDAGGRDAVAHEVQDRCNGHPQREGEYHYHGPSPCLEGANERGKLLGYALDGFGIYSSVDESGRELGNADLDECHGRTAPVWWEGQRITLYHYVLTREYPYTMGCFRGTPVWVASRPGNEENGAPGMPGNAPAGGQGGAQRQGPEGYAGGGRVPPPEAQVACQGQAEGSGCRFVTPRGDVLHGQCRQIPGNVVACVPAGR